MLRREPPIIEVGFLAGVSFAGQRVPVMSVCIRLDYTNFDRWPPSLAFIDPFTRVAVPPLVSAPDVVDGQLGNALVHAHPETGRPFLCLPGIREFHTHPQHSGEDWLLHRDLGEGDLAVICERVWRRMARNVLGVSVNVVSVANVMQMQMQLAQTDPDSPIGAADQEPAATQQPAAPSP